MRLHKKKRVIIYLKIKECNVDNSLEIDCGHKMTLFLLGRLMVNKLIIRSALNMYIDI